MNPCKVHRNFRGDVCVVCLKNENDFLKMELRQTQARLNHADKEIERIKEENENILKDGLKGRGK